MPQSRPQQLRQAGVFDRAQGEVNSRLTPYQGPLPRDAPSCTRRRVPWPDMDNAFGLRATDGARWISREKLYGAQTKGVNRRAIAIKEQPDLHYRPARYQFPGVPHFQKAYVTRQDPSGTDC